jgi:hypothetical protein
MITSHMSVIEIMKAMLAHSRLAPSVAQGRSLKNDSKKFAKTGWRAPHMAQKWLIQRLSWWSGQRWGTELSA